MKLYSPAKDTLNLPVWLNRLILYTPFFLFAAFTVFLAIPFTRSTALWVLAENHPVELATFVFFLWAGVLGLKLAGSIVKGRHHLYASAFYALFSIALVVIAMEEVAWGQWVFGFETPDCINHINAQQETTLHNMGCLQGKSELFRLAFSIGGLLGVMIHGMPRFNIAGVPPLLFPWFLIITAHALLDVYNDYFPIEKQFDAYMQRTSELVELLIAMAVFLYILLNSKRISPVLGKQGPSTGRNETNQTTIHL
ncbi:MAG: hypothetical protein ABFR33_08240 [Verrucomicrobiota bacterium]